MGYIFLLIGFLATGAFTAYCIINRLFRWNRKKSLEFFLDRLLPELEKAGIRYWLDFGTLLGAWRSGSVVPYDYDVDISVHADQIQNVERLLESLPEGLYVKGKKEGIWYKIRAKRRLCSFDIYVYHDLADGNLCQSFACSLKNGVMECIPYETYGKVDNGIIFPTVPGKISTARQTYSVFFPAKTGEYLNCIYENPGKITHRGLLKNRIYIKKSFKARRWTFE